MFLSQAVSKTYHHGNLRRALLDAAKALIEERGGPDRFTMAEAGRRAGVSSGAPYRHFADRSALLSALAQEGQAMLDARIKKIAEPEPGEHFRQIGIAYAAFAAEEPVYFQVMTSPEYGRVDPPHPDELEFWQPLSRLLQGYAPDDALPAHPLLTALAARALVHGLAHMLALDILGPFGIERSRARQLADAITRAVDLIDPSDPGSKGS